MANTFTPLYDELEDRIILVINYEDIQNRVDFMITRSFILKLLPAADEFIAQHYDNSHTNNNVTIATTSSQENTNENGLSKTNNENLEFFAREKELLRELNFTFIADKGLTTLSFSSQESLVVASLDYNMFQQLIKALKTSIPSFSWGIATNF